MKPLFKTSGANLPLPDLLIACVGGGSNAIGLFFPVLEDQSVRLVGVEAWGEGIIPALDSAHAIAEVIRRAPTIGRAQLIIVNLSGRGDKDVEQVAAKHGLKAPS